MLAQAKALLPAGLGVILTADRAYDIPPFVDRVSALGWHGLVRAKLGSSLRFRDCRGHDQPLRAAVAARVRCPGQRWKGGGWAFKAAGWRAVSIVAHWERRQDEPLVLLTDLPPRWQLLACYDRRFWCEPAFRNDKTRGWQWEQSQVRSVAHQGQLLLAMAWASLIVPCLGVVEAEARLARLRRRRPGRGRLQFGWPQHARQSLFRLGLHAARRGLYGTFSTSLPWRLPALDAPSWTAQWCAAQAQQLIFQTVRP